MMSPEETVFEKSYKSYLEQIRGVNIKSAAPVLGATTDGSIAKIPFFKTEYSISPEKITGPTGEKPAYDICVILSKYLLLCPDKPPKDKDWVSFRDLKDSGPLITYFANDVERAIALSFSGRPGELEKAGNMLGGYPPGFDADYDVALTFDALPMIPVVMLFNDADEEFSATCSVLFERRVEKYLDAECIAMLGRQLFAQLKIISRYPE